MNLDINTNNQKSISKNFKYLKSFFMLCGIGGIILGLIHIWSFISQEFLFIYLADAIINIFLGVFLLICYRILLSRKKLLLWFFPFAILISVAYGFSVGRGFNFIYSIIGVIIWYKLFDLKKNNELS